jgi:hypothetical protein
MGLLPERAKFILNIIVLTTKNSVLLVTKISDRLTGSVKINVKPFYNTYLNLPKQIDCLLIA